MPVKIALHVAGELGHIVIGGLVRHVEPGFRVGLVGQLYHHLQWNALVRRVPGIRFGGSGGKILLLAAVGSHPVHHSQSPERFQLAQPHRIERAGFHQGLVFLPDDSNVANVIAHALGVGAGNGQLEVAIGGHADHIPARGPGDFRPAIRIDDLALTIIEDDIIAGVIFLRGIGHQQGGHAGEHGANFPVGQTLDPAVRIDQDLVLFPGIPPGRTTCIHTGHAKRNPLPRQFEIIDERILVGPVDHRRQIHAKWRIAMPGQPRGGRRLFDDGRNHEILPGLSQQ